MDEVRTAYNRKKMVVQVSSPSLTLLQTWEKLFGKYLAREVSTTAHNWSCSTVTYIHVVYNTTMRLIRYQRWYTTGV